MLVGEGEAHLDNRYQKGKRLATASDGFHNHVLVAAKDFEA
jgi:hypothetical protein